MLNDGGMAVGENGRSHQHRSDAAVYNSANRQMSSSSRWVLCALLLGSHLCFASDWRKPEAQLAEKIAAVTGPGVIALNVENRSSIPTSDVEQIQRDLISSLGTAGIHVWQPDQAAATVKVTLSENLQNYVWVAEIQQGGNETRIVMVSAPGPDSMLSSQNAPPINLRLTPLISRPQAILDAAVLEGNPRRLLILDANDITIYEFHDNKWIAGQRLPITHHSISPRDVRGRIILRKDHLFDAYLPGLVCHSTNSNPMTMDCAHSDDPWPLQTAEFGVSAFFSPTRNFFPGALVPGIGKQRSAPQFYSAAAVPKANYVLWIFGGTDNQLHLLDGISQQTAGKVRWGSDIAGIHAACRPDWQVIASSPESESEDWLQVFEFPDREPIAVSQRMALKGTVTALWTAQGGDNATVIYRNSESGNYEAAELNLACSQ